MDEYEAERLKELGFDVPVKKNEWDEMELVEKREIPDVEQDVTQDEINQMMKDMGIEIKHFEKTNDVQEEKYDEE